jgi:arginase
VVTVHVPYHLAERLRAPLLSFQDRDHIVVTLRRELGTGTVWTRLARLYGAVASEVEQAVRDRDIPTVVSGDCMTALGTLAGLHHAGVFPSVVWIDAHADLQTFETTSTGYLGGFPLRMALGYQSDLLALPLGLRPVPEDRVLLTGTRHLDPAESRYLDSSGIRRVDLPDLIPEVLPPGPLYLHIDLDVLDPTHFPGLNRPVTGGPSATSLATTVRRIRGTGRVVAIGTACTWDPALVLSDPGAELREALSLPTLAVRPALPLRHRPTRPTASCRISFHETPSGHDVHMFP